MSAPSVPFVASVLHPSDFSDASESAFAHALAIALLRKARLTMLHVGAEPLAEDEWGRFPAVRTTLARWGVLDAGAPRAALFEKLGIHVDKVSLTARSAAGGIAEYMEERPHDLVVLATEGRDGLPAWVHPSTAERVARRSDALALFVPRGARGFVSPTDGTTTLRRILVPVAAHPDPRPAVVYAARAATALGDPPVDVAALHVGADEELPSFDLPRDPAFSWRRMRRDGDVVEAILAAAEEQPADLVVMATAGHERLLDALRGSTTEQVLRGAPCPLLAVPEWD
jgi:nucleotide-binding universal stress UspA family protein